MDERKITAKLIDLTTKSGIQADPVELVGLYVALKAKPMLILTGQANSGKTLVVESLMQVLNGGNPRQCQMLTGHAWWAGRTGNTALFSEAQTRLTTGKIMALIDEARKPENADRVFLACLTRISLAEVAVFFPEMAFQIRNERLMRLPSFHYTEPIPFPSNLFFIGTIDTSLDNWTNDDLDAVTTLMDWRGALTAAQIRGSVVGTVPGSENLFLRSCIRSEEAACAKLSSILGDTKQPLRPLFEMAELLGNYALVMPPSLINSATVYLANAWTANGHGLFAEDNPENLAGALDFVIAHGVLRPHIGQIRQAAPLTQKLQALLDRAMPRSVNMLNPALT